MLSEQVRPCQGRISLTVWATKYIIPYFNSSPEIIRNVVMLYVRYPLSLRQVEDILFERGIDICHEAVRYWWKRFGPLFAAEVRKRRIVRRNWSNWRWHIDEVFVRINGETRYL